MAPVPPYPPPADKKAYKKIIVAVHGIGKQSRNSTIRSVTLMAAENLPGAPGVVSSSYPLGYFYSSGVGAAANVSPFDEIPDGDEKLSGIGFSEVFWADIPQGVMAESRTMEESKEWARTVVARAQRLYERHHGQAAHGGNGVRKNGKDGGKPDRAHRKLVEPDFGLAAEVLDEIIDTVYVLENLSWLAEKAGLMSFDVREVMDEYLGDVQLVTEFSYYRNDIVGRFHEAMETIHLSHPGAEIHVVAHSEGSVVAFLGLLNALHGQRVHPAVYADGRRVTDPKEDPPASQPLKWLGNVKGFMTIGSPIDKHFLLWPKLFEKFDLGRSAELMTAGGLLNDQIKWRNYYDLADPVGYKLDTIRLWLERGEKLTDKPVPAAGGGARKAFVFPRFSKQPANNPEAEERYRKRVCKLFEFKDPEDFKDAHHDIGFTRYLLPGKAHNDYWDDVDLFNHFIQDVVNAPDGSSKDPGVEAVEPPRTRRMTGFISAVLPFLLSATFLCAATFILLRGVTSYYAPAIEPVDHYMRMMLTGDSSASEEYTARYLLLEFGAWALMLAGTTTGARVHRLGGPRWIWWPVSFVMISLGASLVDGKMILTLLDVGPLLTKPMLTTGLIVTCLGVMVASDKLGRIQSPRKKAKKTKTAKEFSHRSDPRERRLRWLFKGARPLVLLGAVITLIMAFVPSLGDVRRNRENLGLAISAKYLHHLTVAGAYKPGELPEPSKEHGDEIIRDLSKTKKGRRMPRFIVGFVDEVERRLEETLPESPEKTAEKIQLSDLEKRKNEQIIQQLAEKDIGADASQGDPAPSPSDAADLERAVPAPRVTGGNAAVPAAAAKEFRVKAYMKVQQDYANFLKVLNVTPSVWPMILSWLAFCYLWWLSILIFDLSYVWHRYVRQGDMIKCLMSWKFSKGL
ncbi:hypothetical protein JIN84_03420 [Luteolibacter yonseiensis]|uniref:Transmembrane protein n=1 Tax=Luteolibacter yonseiensis TaxID=1144680 RepID=A0A934R0T2_9BACT|nr:hypothetical protein [Luteolibacter yonseiensis]MBK1814647.1 hypothetical protein [Luteolibacter yonseiensis]